MRWPWSRREAVAVASPSRVPVNAGQYGVDVEARAGYVQVQSWLPLSGLQLLDLDPEAARLIAAALEAAADDVESGNASHIKVCEGSYSPPPWR